MTNPPGYIPSFMRRDKAEMEDTNNGGGGGLFGKSGDMFFDDSNAAVDNDER